MIRGGVAVGRYGSLSVAALTCAALLAPGCTGPREAPTILTAEVPLHLEQHLDVATVRGSEPPANLPEFIEFGAAELRTLWNPAAPLMAGFEPATIEAVDDGVRLVLTGANRNPRNVRLSGSIYVELPDLRLLDWSYADVTVRASPSMRNLGVGFNYSEKDPHNELFPWYSGGPSAPLVSDGTEQTYRIPLRPARSLPGPWTEMEIWANTFAGADSGSLEVVSVRLVPAGEVFAAEPVGVRLHPLVVPAPSDATERRSLYAHAPARISFPVTVPPQGRLDVGLAVLDDQEQMEFTVLVEHADGETEVLLAETHADPGAWADRSIDLAHLAGETVGLVLGLSSESPGAVGLWGAPTVVGVRDPDLPNIVFYVIDGAGADYMSLYGYNRRTTPNLDRIAAQGAVFERAYSNSGWTRPSTASFLTSLQHSVLGGLRQGFNPVPEGVLTMAEHMHRAGFQTGEFTTNPNAGKMSGLERGVDVFRDAGAAVTSRSSSELHRDYWRWREAYPGEPYWVHFQTTDLHGPHTPVPPFAGLFLSPDRRALAEEWNDLMWHAPDDGDGIWGGSFEATGVDRIAYASAFRDYYDEGVAHQDFQLGRLVERLAERGEWEHTLLIVASDHGAAAGSQDWRLLMREDAPIAVDYSDPATPLYRTGVSRIPLVFVWPEKIAAGQRFSDPVSMIDVLPTALDLVGLPLPEIMQGQSLAPLLRGEPGWEPRPVILDQFELDDDSGELRGRIEVIDGRWGASLEINPDPAVREQLRRPVPLLLHDLWTDPDAVHSLHEERPDLAARYTEFLEAQFAAHQALAQRFTSSGGVTLTPEQLRTLRALGYIR